MISLFQLQLMYRPFFPTIYYCSNVPDEEGQKVLDDLASKGWNVTLVISNPNPINGEEWWIQNYKCIDSVHQHEKIFLQHPQMTGGFLVIGDDVFLPPEKCKNTDDFCCSKKCALADSQKCLNSSTVWMDVIQIYFSSE